MGQAEVSVMFGVLALLRRVAMEGQDRPCADDDQERCTEKALGCECSD